MEFTKEIDQLIEKMTGEKILHHTCQLLVKGDNGELKPHGSGVFIIISETHFLLTASHVTKDWSDMNQIYIRVSKSNYISLVGQVRETNIDAGENIDLAYVILDTATLPDLLKAYNFLPISKIRDHKKLINATNYCVMGYPEKSNASIDGKIEPIAQAYYLKPSPQKVYKYYKFDPETSYIFEIKGKGVNIKTGNTEKISPHFYGISGCGLWLMIVDEQGETHLIDYKLIGIMTEFRNSRYFVLIGIKIRLILEGIMTLEKINLREKKTY